MQGAAGRSRQPRPGLSHAFLPGPRIHGVGGGAPPGRRAASGLQLPESGCHWRRQRGCRDRPGHWGHSLTGGAGLCARPSARRWTMPCPRILSTSRFYKMTLRVRRVKVPPEELDLQLKTTAPALPWGGGWVPRPGAQHFAPLLKSCSIPGGPFYGVLPIATVRQSRLVSSLKPSCCCCFGAMPLALEMERKRTPSQWPKSFL